MLANVLIILMDERYGVTPAPNFGRCCWLNLPWLLFPVPMILRMRRDHPFRRPAADAPATRVRDGAFADAVRAVGRGGRCLGGLGAAFATELAAAGSS